MRRSRKKEDILPVASPETIVSQSSGDRIGAGPTVETVCAFVAIDLVSIDTSGAVDTLTARKCQILKVTREDKADRRQNLVDRIRGIAVLRSEGLIFFFLGVIDDIGVCPFPPGKGVFPMASKKIAPLGGIPQNHFFPQTAIKPHTEAKESIEKIIPPFTVE